MLLTEFNQTLYDQGLLDEGKRQNQVTMVKNLMDSMKWSSEKAMTVLKIPQESKDYILSELQK